MECLVTKLKSVVNDDNLLKLGEIRMVFTKGAGTEIGFQAKSNGGIVIDGKNIELKTYQGSQLSLPYNISILDGVDASVSSYKIVSTRDDAYISIFNSENYRNIQLYDSVKLVDSYNSIDKLDFINFKRIRAIGQNIAFVPFNILDLKDKDLIEISISNSTLNGNISDFSNFKSLDTIRFKAPYVTGNIENLKNNITLTTIGFNNSISGISGDIDTLAKGMVAAGRTSGTLTIDAYGAVGVTENEGTTPFTSTRTFTFSSDSPNGYTKV